VKTWAIICGVSALMTAAGFINAAIQHDAFDVGFAFAATCLYVVLTLVCVTGLRKRSGTVRESKQVGG
jgi:hypothetical protein